MMKKIHLPTMPAAEHAFADALPPRLYLDTDIVIAALVVTEPLHAQAQGFFDRLARESSTELFVSSLTWLEFTNAIMRDQFRSSLSVEMRQQFQLDRWQIAAVRRVYLQFLLDQLETFLDQFPWEEVPLAPAVRVRAMHYVSTYNLRPSDAAHAASADHAGVTNLASFDAAFRRVDGLHLWNDHIHTRAQV